MVTESPEFIDELNGPTCRKYSFASTSAGCAGNENGKVRSGGTRDQQALGLFRTVRHPTPCSFRGSQMNSQVPTVTLLVTEPRANFVKVSVPNALECDDGTAEFADFSSIRS